MRRVVLACVVVALAAMGAKSQTNVMRFTDYGMVAAVVNPSCVGLQDGVSGLLLYRSRFEKSDYWPSTGVFNLNTGIKDKGLGGGLNVIFDKYGPYEKLFAYVAGSYKMRMSESSFLLFGLQAGINYVSNSGDYHPADAEEVIFSDNYSQPNFGFGLHYQTPKFYLGASIPEFRYNTINEKGEKVNSMMSNMLKVFVYGGGFFKMSESTMIEPYVWGAYSGEDNLTVDFGAKLRYKDAFIIGVQYRTEESFAAMARVRLTGDLWLGYAFEGNNSDIDNSFNSVQEIGLTFRFGGKKKGESSIGDDERYDEIKSIRYF